MNWRVLGCGVVGVVAFVGVGLLGLSMATSRIGCPDRLQWASVAYLPDGAATRSPVIADDAGRPPVRIGSTLIGLASRSVYGPAGTDISDASAPRPTRIAMDCGDGTYQSYRGEPGRGAAP